MSQSLTEKAAARQSQTPEQAAARKSELARSNLATIETAISVSGEDNQALFKDEVIAALCYIRSNESEEYKHIRAKIIELERKVSIVALEKKMDVRDKPVSPTTAIAKRTKELNAQYVHALINGNARIVDVSTKRFEYIKVSSFHSHFENERYEFNGKKVSISKLWFPNENRISYPSVKFAPGTISGNFLNLWRGFSVDPFLTVGVFQSGMMCRKFLSHLKYNICNGDREQFRYLIRWCADMFQNPQFKPGVALSISGKKGVGKSKVAEALAALLSIHAITVSSHHHMFGNFNAHKSQALLLIAEEAFWAGDKQAEGMLKHEITAATTMAEFKGIDAFEVDSFLRQIFIGNDPWIFPATEDERRLAAFACGDKHQKDYPYFQAIDDQLYGKGKRKFDSDFDKPPNGLRALLTFFMRLNLTGFNVRAAPETQALMDQREATLKPHEQFFFNLLDSRVIGWANSDDFDYIKEKAYWPDECQYISRDDLYENFVKSIPHHVRQKAASMIIFNRWVRKAMKWDDYREQIGTSGGKTDIGLKRPQKGYYWIVPPYSVALGQFEDATKVRVR